MPAQLYEASIGCAAMVSPPPRARSPIWPLRQGQRYFSSQSPPLRPSPVPIPPMPPGIPVDAIGATVGLLTGERELMTQNLVTLNLTDAQITAVSAALTELETQLSGLISLSTPAKRAAMKMGPK